MINDERGNFLCRILFDEVRFVNLGSKEKAVGPVLRLKKVREKRNSTFPPI